MTNIFGSAFFRKTSYSGYQIDQSMVLDGSSDYLSRTPGSAATDETKWTVSFWVKRWALDSGATLHYLFAAEPAAATILAWYQDHLYFQINDSGGAAYYIQTTRKFRDVGSFYHIVAVWDRDAGTAVEKLRLYINGTEETDFSVDQRSSFTASADSGWHKQSTLNTISRRPGTASGYSSDYIAEFHSIDGQALTPTSFGEFYNGTTAWRPIQPSGLTYGTNGFYLPFTQDTPNLGVDYSGNGNDWTENGSPVQSSDSPTKNYATLNVLAGNRSFSNGNRTWTATAVGVAPATMECSPNSGNWYAEINIDAVSSGAMVGVVDASFYYRSSNTRYPGDTGETDQLSLGYWHGNGNKYVNGINSAYGATYTTGDVIGILINTDDGEVTFYKNNISQGAISYDNTRGVMFACGYADNSGSGVQTIVFDENDWTYSAPSDAKALYAANLPDPTITDPGEYFNAVAYTGDGTAIGSGGNSITGVGFQPDFTWIKNRDDTNKHQIYDILRGTQKVIHSNQTLAESTESEGLNSFDSDGFTVGSNGGENTNTDNYISWNWKAGGAGVPNTDGSISSTVSVNDDAGFSIVSWTLGSTDNQTVGHGLSAAPEFMFLKNRDTAGGWTTYHKDNTSAPETDYLRLHSDGATVDDVVAWNDTAPTNSVFTIGDVSWFGSASDEMIMYCFRSIPGYSAFGSYTGNGSADGPFIYTGFRPAFVMIKETTSTGNWQILDTTRSPYNVINNDSLWANLSSAESGASAYFDVLSNGFKIRDTDSDKNSNGQTYIYMAFAENPFGGSNIPLGLAQ